MDMKHTHFFLLKTTQALLSVMCSALIYVSYNPRAKIMGYNFLRKNQIDIQQFEHWKKSLPQKGMRRSNHQTTLASPRHLCRLVNRTGSNTHQEISLDLNTCFMGGGGGRGNIPSQEDMIWLDKADPILRWHLVLIFVLDFKKNWYFYTVQNTLNYD